MKRTLAIVAVLFYTAGVTSAQITPAPILKTVTKTDKTKAYIALYETVTRSVPVQKEVVVIENGMQVKQIVTTHVVVHQGIATAIDATKIRAMTPDGKQVPIEEVWKRLKENTVVVVSADGNTPAETYLRALHADTLVLILPQEKMPPVGEPVPPPRKN